MRIVKATSPLIMISQDLDYPYDEKSPLDDDPDSYFVVSVYSGQGDPDSLGGVWLDSGWSEDELVSELTSALGYDLDAYSIVFDN